MLALQLALALAWQGVPSVEEFRLKNGLTVLLRPVPKAPTTALVLLFNIGGDHDPPGKSGMAHFVEHLYCIAAAGKSGARTHEQMMQRYPKGSNAQTGDRYTVYAVVFPSADLAQELQEAAARLGDLRITQADLQQELPRMQIELANMFGRLPHLAAMNQARELVRPTPHKGRKGGRLEHLQTISVAEAQERWRRYYKPCNATLILCGGWDDKTRSLIEKYFGPIPAGQPIPPPAEPGTPQFGKVYEATVASLIPNSRTEAALAFTPPLPASEEYPAFLVLARRLQVRQGQLHAGTGRFPLFFTMLDDPHFLGLGVPVQPEETGQAALQRLESFVSETVQAPLEKRELQSLQPAWGSFLGLRDPSAFEMAGNPYGVAFALGRRRQLGLDGNTLRQRIEALTEEDMRRAAKKFFSKERSAGAILMPQKSP